METTSLSSFLHLLNEIDQKWPYKINQFLVHRTAVNFDRLNPICIEKKRRTRSISHQLMGRTLFTRFSHHSWRQYTELEVLFSFFLYDQRGYQWMTTVNGYPFKYPFKLSSGTKETYVSLRSFLLESWTLINLSHFIFGPWANWIEKKILQVKKHETRKIVLGIFQFWALS